MQHANLHASERELPHQIKWLRGSGTLRALAGPRQGNMQQAKITTAPLRPLKRGKAIVAAWNHRCRDQPAQRAAGIPLATRLTHTRHNALMADVR